MANGKWQMANGKWRMADGRWRMAESGCAKGEFLAPVTRRPRAAPAGCLRQVISLRSVSGCIRWGTGSRGVARRLARPLANGLDPFGMGAAGWALWGLFFLLLILFFFCGAMGLRGLGLRLRKGSALREVGGLRSPLQKRRRRS
jgi:hypothetical protein